MSLEHDPARDDPTAASGLDGLARGPPDDPDYWWSLIKEEAGAAFLSFTVRTMQSLRQRGDGPKYIWISSRCIRYRRIDLKIWADARVRASTSET